MNLERWIILDRSGKPVGEIRASSHRGQALDAARKFLGRHYPDLTIRRPKPEECPQPNHAKGDR